jgi:hypothetical protein
MGQNDPKLRKLKIAKPLFNEDIGAFILYFRNPAGSAITSSRIRPLAIVARISDHERIPNGCLAFDQLRSRQCTV